MELRRAPFTVTSVPHTYYINNCLFLILSFFLNLQIRGLSPAFSEWISQFWFTVSFSSHWRGKNGPIYFALLKVTAYRGVELVNKVNKIL